MGRHIINRAAAAVLALSASAWCLSIVQLAWESSRMGRSFYLGQGAVCYVNATFDNPGFRSLGPAWPTKWRPAFDTYQFYSPAATLTYVQLPLWIPAAAASATLIGLPLLARRRRLRAGCCPACGYDLVGIFGPCPECGRNHAKTKGRRAR